MLEISWELIDASGKLVQNFIDIKYLWEMVSSCLYVYKD